MPHVRTTRNLLVLALAVTGLLATASPSHAFQTTTTGRAGAVALPALQGSHYDLCPNVYVNGVRIPCWNAWVLRNPITISRVANVRGAQRVWIDAQIQRWDGNAWQRMSAGSQTGWYTINANSRAITLSSVNFYPQGAGYFRQLVGVGWSDSRGRSLGVRALVTAHAGDQFCNTRFQGCANYTNQLYVGGGGALRAGKHATPPVADTGSAVLGAVRDARTALRVG